MANPKIVILGANGLLGTYLVQQFKNEQPIALTHTELDIANAQAVKETFHTIKPQIVINAAAFTAVDRCETEIEQCMLINGTAPGLLAEAAKEIDATLIHYSTDYIFDGKREEGYPEDWQEKKPINTYGRSKLEGEEAIQHHCDQWWSKVYLIRTAWLYGTYGANFVDTMLRLSEQRQQLKVVNDQHGSPTFVHDLAERTHWIVEHAPSFGIYHCTNSGVCTWYEFARAIFEIAKKTVDVVPCSSAAFPRPAHRPAYSILLNTKLPPLRPWKEALADYLQSRSRNL